MSRIYKILPFVLVALLTGCASKSHLEDKKVSEQPAAATSANTTAQTDKSASSNEAPESAVTPAAVDVNQTVFYFDFDQDSIKQEAYPALKNHAKFLSSHPKAAVRLEGSTDERGTREYNLALGERRAKAVAQFLTINGAAANQIETVSYGEEKPKALEHDESAWAQNRRVELQYTAGK